MSVETGWIGWAADRLASPRRAALVAALLAVVLTLPSLAIGLVQDDLSLYATATDQADALGPRAAWDLFRFYSDAELVRRVRDAGLVPWWTVDELRLAFFRPLSSLWHTAELRAFGTVGWPQHLSSVLLYGASAVAVGVVMRRLEPDARVAGLATVLWAIDDAHGMPVGWVCNRNGVLAWLLGAVALVLHDRWRQGWRPGAVAAPAVAALALGAGESALGVWAYFLGYALFLDRGGWADRLRSVVPYGAVLVGWRIVYQLGGYGTAGSAFYVDPGSDPVGFLGVVPIRLGVLLAAQLGPVPADALLVVPAEARPAFVAVAIASAGLVAAALASVGTADRHARFWAFGLVVSLVPVCATFPSERLLGFAGIGAFVWIARAMLAGRRWLAIGLGIVHVGLAAPLLPLRSVAVASVGTLQRAAARSMPDEGGGELVVVAAPDWFVPSFGALTRTTLDGKPRLGALRLLVSGEPDAVVRIDERTLLVSGDAGLLRDTFASVVRDRGFTAGERFDVGDWRIDVLQTALDGAPTRIRFTAPGPLEVPGRTWMTWDPSALRLVPWPVPAVPVPQPLRR